MEYELLVDEQNQYIVNEESKILIKLGSGETMYISPEDIGLTLVNASKRLNEMMRKKKSKINYTPKSYTPSE